MMKGNALYCLVFENVGGRSRTTKTDSSSDTLSATDLRSQPLSLVDLAQNPQQTETFWDKDRTGDCQRDGNLRLETAFFSKASYFFILV
jgi:hypothetical protein